jgi:hypothetical protein
MTNTRPGSPEDLVVAQSVFGGSRFWSGLDRLADRQGHNDHARVLTGRPEPTNRYTYSCITCGTDLAVLTVTRDDA